MDADIANALETAVIGWAVSQSPEVQMAFGSVFEPTPGVPYVEVHVMPNRTRNLYLANDAPSQHIGILQVTVCYPNGEGYAPARVLADSVAAFFAKGKKMPAGGAVVEVYEFPSVASPMQAPDRVRVPISIRYQAIA